MASATPVNSLIVNKNTNSKDHNSDELYVIWDSCKVANHGKILIPVETEIIIILM